MNKIVPKDRRKTSLKRRRSSKKKKSENNSRRGSMDEIASAIDRQVNKYNAKEDYREITMREMMKLYNPKWVTYVGLLASLAHGATLPIFGFVLSKYIFLLADPHSSPAE